MLAAVRWRAVMIGFGLGTLAVAALALVLWLILSLLSVEDAASIATAFGTLGGFLVAGWLAGRRAPFSPWYHGALAAMGIALIVVVTARLGGSPAPTSQILLLAAIAIGLGAAGGFVGGNRAHRSPG